MKYWQLEWLQWNEKSEQFKELNAAILRHFQTLNGIGYMIYRDLKRFIYVTKNQSKLNTKLNEAYRDQKYSERMNDARHFHSHPQTHYMKIRTTTTAKNERNRLKGLKVFENSLLKQNCNQCRTNATNKMKLR